MCLHIYSWLCVDRISIEVVQKLLHSVFWGKWFYCGLACRFHAFALFVKWHMGGPSWKLCPTSMLLQKLSYKSRMRHNGKFCDILCLTTDWEFIDHFHDSICGILWTGSRYDTGVVLKPETVASGWRRASSQALLHSQHMNAALYEFKKIYYTYFISKKALNVVFLPWRNQKAFFAKQSACVDALYLKEYE